MMQNAEEKIESVICHKSTERQRTKEKKYKADKVFQQLSFLRKNLHERNQIYLKSFFL